MKIINQAHTMDYTAYQADCVELTRNLPDSSVDFSVYSPPFSGLYVYSDSERDMGNCADDAEFFEHYNYLLRELYRATRPGRLSAVHVKDLIYFMYQRGKTGLRDFSGDCIRAHIEAGFDFHARITIWRCPVREMQKTKSHGLLYKTIKKDSTFSRQGLPEYLLIFRKWAEDGEEVSPVRNDPGDFPVEQWQQWASPVWMDTNASDVLNVRTAREDKDEKHLCPMPLDLTERAVILWSNPGDTVYSPFMGVGSEGVVALRNGRKFIGAELKESYWKQAVKHLDETAQHAGTPTLLDVMAGQ